MSSYNTVAAKILGTRFLKVHVRGSVLLPQQQKIATNDKLQSCRETFALSDSVFSFSKYFSVSEQEDAKDDTTFT